MELFLIILFKIFSLILTQTCGVKDPINLQECLSSSSTNSICCYTKIQGLEKNDTLCIFVPKSQIFITPHIKSLDIGSNEGNIDIELDCGFVPDELKEGEPYSYCGESPETPSDCIKNSNPNASCCFIKNPNGETFCVLNNGIYNSNSSYFGVNIVCQGNSINIDKLIYFILFCFLLIF